MESSFAVNQRVSTFDSEPLHMCISHNSSVYAGPKKKNETTDRDDELLIVLVEPWWLPLPHAFGCHIALLFQAMDNWTIPEASVCSCPVSLCIVEDDWIFVSPIPFAIHAMSRIEYEKTVLIHIINESDRQTSGKPLLKLFLE